MVSSSSIILLVAMIFATVYSQTTGTTGAGSTALPTSGGTTGNEASPTSSGTSVTTDNMVSTSSAVPVTKFVHSQQTLPALAIGTIALCLML
ncbi:hypothetical protein WR25_12030 [Diploscapter pachys]|uniref:Uncharacterized protein n=1 Tax=Diploscapter pachys TaxID=2018661 RepID=A0A2A2KWX7_9BILA|nr:hypothetical protein WR25_12030 [Diploscapter pachys]